MRGILFEEIAPTPRAARHVIAKERPALNVSIGKREYIVKDDGACWVVGTPGKETEGRPTPIKDPYYFTSIEGVANHLYSVGLRKASTTAELSELVDIGRHLRREIREAFDINFPDETN